MNALSPLGEAALKYAVIGFHVFPCKQGEKVPAGWLVGNGHKDATTDVDIIRSWWLSEPNANIGVHLKRSGLVAVDPDVYKPDCEWSMFTDTNSIPETLVQRSPRGGYHYIYLASADAEYAGKLCRGVDIKSDGYILLSPSVVGGKTYDFVTHVDPSEAPAWIPRKGNSTPVLKTPSQPLASPSSDRSGTFFKTVLALRESGLGLDAVEAALRADAFETGAIKYIEGSNDRLRTELERVWAKANPPSKSRTFRLRLAGEFEASEPEWLIEGILEMGTLALLFGDPGLGKSFLAIDWAYCVAMGIGFLGRPARQGVVVYVAGEGQRGFGRRREAWGQHHGVFNDHASIYMSEGPANMLDAVLEVKLAIADLPGPPSLIIFDTLARNFGGGDENSTKDMSAFIAAIDDLKADYPDCVVLIVHHSGHSDKHRARGAMALKGAVDIEYRLEPTPKGMLLSNTKMKDGEPPEPMSLALETVGLSAVIVEGEMAPSGAIKERLSSQQRMALDALVSVAVDTGHIGDDSPVSLEAWRQAFYSLHQGNDNARRQAFNTNRRNLETRGFVQKDGDGYRPDHIRQMAIKMKNIMKKTGAS